MNQHTENVMVACETRTAKEESCVFVRIDRRHDFCALKLLI